MENENALKILIVLISTLLQMEEVKEEIEETIRKFPLKILH